MEAMNTATLTLSTHPDLTPQLVSDLLVTCFEGGSTYWMSGVQYTMPINTEWLPDNAMNPKGQPRYAYVPLNECGSILIKGDGVPGWKILNKETIIRGLKLLESDPVSAGNFCNITNESWDAGDADVFLQLCLFGSVVFG